MRFPAGDPRNARTLGEAGRNPDGTYNLAKTMSWLTAAMSRGGKGLSQAEVQEIIDREIAKRRVRAPEGERR